MNGLISSPPPPPSAPAGRRAWLWPAALGGAILSVPAVPAEIEPLVFFSADKVAHVAVFGLLATAVVRAGGLRRAWLAVAAVALFGAVDEARQALLPGRTADAADWVADAIGASAAVALYRWIPRYRAFLERRIGRRRGGAARGTGP